MSDYPDLPQAPAPALVQTSTMAIVSLIAGIVCWFALPVIGAIIAIITGYMARNEIRQSGGRLTGDGMATAGLILGWVHLGLVVVGLCLGLTFLALGITLPFLCIPFFNQPQSLLFPLFF